MVGDFDPDAHPLDWQGQPVRCRDCAHFSLNREGLCRKGAACVRDRRARRVDGFFKKHPQLANNYLDHSYFEVRAMAAKYASLLRLQTLLIDPEPEVRAMAAARLPTSRLGALARDPEPRVRIVLANRLEGAALVAMLDDPDYLVRVNVVRRLDPDLLPWRLETRTRRCAAGWRGGCRRNGLVC